MYSDSISSTLFTGYYDSDAGEYVYPTARQDALIFVDTETLELVQGTPTYLSALDGDFTTDGITYSMSVGESTDMRIGTAMSAVLTGTLLNPYGLMNNLRLSSKCQAFIGVVTASEAITVPANASCYLEKNSHSYYSIGGIGYEDGVALFSGTDEIISIVDAPLEDGTESTYPLFYTSAGKVWEYLVNVVSPLVEGWNYVTSSSSCSSFMDKKFLNSPQCATLYGYSNGQYGTIRWDVKNAEKVTWSYIPLGVFDFSEVSIYGDTFTFEVYDRMTAFDADATEWLSELDWTSKTLSAFIGELMTKVCPGVTYSIDANAVNLTTTYTASPFTDYAVTYRQLLKWCAEAIGCNARFDRLGYMVFYCYNYSPVATINPNTIVSNTRSVSRYDILSVNSLTLYYKDGTYGNFSVRSPGISYTVLGNPFITNATAFLEDLFDVIRNRRPDYYVTSFSDACADPHIDVGDILTIERSDGTTYISPVMQYTLSWNGLCVAEISATGNQESLPPSASELDGYASKVANYQLTENYVAKAGDTMTGDLENESVSTRRTVMQGSRFYVENTSDVSQYSSLAYDGIYATDGIGQTTITPNTTTIAGSDTTATMTSNRLSLTDGTNITTVDADQTQIAGSTTTNTQTGENIVISGGGFTNSIYRSSSVMTDGTNQSKLHRSYLEITNGTDTATYGRGSAILTNGTNTATLTPTGLDLDGTVLTSGIGANTKSSTTTVSVPTGTYTAVTNFTITPGIWVIIGFLRFGKNATGRRVLAISTTSGSGTTPALDYSQTEAAVSGTQTTVRVTTIRKVSQNTTFYMNAYQDSGSALSVDGIYNFVRIL